MLRRSDRRQASLVGSMVPLIAARGSTQLGTAIVAVIVARSVGPDGFGVFSGLLAVASIVVGGSSSGLPVLAIRRVASGCVADGFPQALSATALRLGAAASVVAVFVDVNLFGLSSAITLGSLAAASSVALTLLTTVSAIRSGRGEYHTSALGEFLGGCGTVIFAALALRIGLGLGGVYAAMTLGSLVGMAFMARRLRAGGGDRNGERSKVRLRELVPFIALGFASTGYVRMDATILGAITTPSTLGQYAAAYRVLGIFTLFGSAFGTVFFAKVSANRQDRRDLLRATCFFGLLVGVPAVAIFLLASKLVVLVFGISYAAAALPLRVLLLSVLPYGLYWPTAHFLNASGRERSFATILVVGTAVDVVLLVVLAPRFGPAGAAAAWAAAEFTTMILCGIVLWGLRPTRGPILRE